MSNSRSEHAFRARPDREFRSFVTLSRIGMVAKLQKGEPCSVPFVSLVSEWAPPPHEGG